jgi:hypothetical protein
VVQLMTVDENWFSPMCGEESPVWPNPASYPDRMAFQGKSASWGGDYPRMRPRMHELLDWVEPIREFVDGLFVDGF